MQSPRRRVRGDTGIQESDRLITTELGQDHRAVFVRRHELRIQGSCYSQQRRKLAQIERREISHLKAALVPVFIRNDLASDILQ